MTAQIWPWPDSHLSSGWTWLHNASTSATLAKGEDYRIKKGRNRTTVRRTILNKLQRANATGYALRVRESDRKKKGNEQTAIIKSSYHQSIQQKPLVKFQSAQLISIKSAQTADYKIEAELIDLRSMRPID